MVVAVVLNEIECRIVQIIMKLMLLVPTSNLYLLIVNLKPILSVPQAREKFLSLRKSTRMDVASVIEEVYPMLVYLDLE